MSKIILLHGLHMYSWVMKPLADMLEKQGFDVALFGYYSVWHTMPQHTQALAEFVENTIRASLCILPDTVWAGWCYATLPPPIPKKSPDASLPSARPTKAAGLRKGCSGSD